MAYDTNATNYFLTVFRTQGYGAKTPEEGRGWRQGRSSPDSRTWGYFTTLQRAEHVVLENRTDIFESGYYDYAVIEQVRDGLYAAANAKERWWFRVRRESNQLQVERAEEPEWARRVEGFCFG